MVLREEEEERTADQRLQVSSGHRTKERLRPGPFQGSLPVPTGNLGAVLRIISEDELQEVVE